MSDNPRLFRRRFIPDELIELKDDEIVAINDSQIITKWRYLKTRKDFDHGASVYYINEGYKISKLLTPENELLYYYCDIVEAVYDEAAHAWTFVDLLFDVALWPNGFIEVLDLDEGADALEQGMITQRQMLLALRALHSLLRIIYDGGFNKLAQVIDGLWREDG